MNEIQHAAKWRTYVIAPIFGERPKHDEAWEHYAPSLDDAFDDARARRPYADGWTCLGGWVGTPDDRPEGSRK